MLSSSISFRKLYERLAQEIIDNLDVQRWIFKFDDEYDGRGTAYCDVSKHLPSYLVAVKEAARYGAKWSKKWAQVCPGVLVVERFLSSRLQRPLCVRIGSNIHKNNERDP
jgi:hypothetical protein